MTKTEITKLVARNVVRISAMWTVTNVIANNTNPEKPHQKVEALVGGLVIGQIVAEYTEDWTDHKIDAIIAWAHRSPSETSTTV